MDTEDYAPFVLADEARLWIANTYPDRERYAAEATDAEAMRFVSDRYEGGTTAFAADVYDFYRFGTLAASLRASIRASQAGY
jgi:cytosine/adenosine deaminase-related metal-dependent hydrolase